MRIDNNKSALDKLKTQLKTGVFSTLYFFHGKESYLIDYYINQIKKSVIPEETAVFNFTKFDLSFDIDEFCDTVSLQPFGDSKRLVLVRNANLFDKSFDAESRKKLTEILVEISENCIVIFAYSGVDFKPDARTALYDVVRKYAEIVEFEPQSNSDLVNWIKRRFSALQRRIDTETASHLINTVGKSMYQLIGEIEKIAAYSETTDISRRHTDAVCVPAPEASAFEIANLICVRRFADALKVLDNYFALREDLIMLHALIGKQLRTLLTAKSLSGRGNAAQKICEIFGYKSAYQAEKLLQNSRLVSFDWCRTACNLAFDVDISLKSGADERFVMEKFVLELSRQ